MNGRRLLSTVDCPEFVIPDSAISATWTEGGKERERRAQHEAVFYNAINVQSKLADKDIPCKMAEQRYGGDTRDSRRGSRYKATESAWKDQQKEEFFLNIP